MSIEEAYQLDLKVEEKLARNVRKRPIMKGGETSVQKWRGGVRMMNQEGSFKSEK